MKDYEMFRKIIKYCKLVNYNINDILKMSDVELKVWYKKVGNMVKDETSFRIMTGLINDTNEHRSIIEHGWK